MNVRNLVLPIVLLVSLVCSHAEGAVLDSLIEEGLENNPRVQAAYNKWQAGEHKVKQVKSLPDPMADYSYFGKNVETRVGPQEHKYGISQTIPFPGKLIIKGKSQSKYAQMLEEQYEAVKREVIKDIKFVYYDIFWVDSAIQVTEGEKAVLESLEKVAQRRYESNLTSQQDVIKAQSELSNLINKLLILRQNRKSLEAKMDSLLNRPRGTGLEDVKGSKPTEFKYDLEELQNMAKESRQELLAADLGIERAKYEKSLAYMGFIPDVTLGFDYIQVGEDHTTANNDGQDAWLGKVAVNVPIWFDKLGARIREKKASLEAAKKNYENVENSVSYEISDLYFKVTTYKEIISLYKNALVPQTEQAFEVTKTGYETGEVDFLDWLDAERVLLQTRLAYYKAIADYQKSLAYLERVIGRDLRGESHEE